MQTTRYRVNLHVYYKQADDGQTVYEVFHVNFWGQEKLARDVVAGLDLRSLAYFFQPRRRHGSVLIPLGKVHAVMGRLVERDGKAIENTAGEIIAYADYGPAEIDAARAA